MLFVERLSDKRFTVLYRCYLTKGGQIVAAENVDVPSLSEAITAGYKMVENAADDVDGIEIWQDRSLLYKTGA